ncbi:hypothetical protein [Vampirovibrio chlorellavorus]|uniref:hypothetical protein n=1 Tax=Vampirovibrio chlorellavorus TaxID=758823 RepID=UPI0026EE8B9E|nr:hypothetical protein [Vampirovibrio chlorellavorus]
MSINTPLTSPTKPLLNSAAEKITPSKPKKPLPIGIKTGPNNSPVEPLRSFTNIFSGQTADSFKKRSDPEAAPNEANPTCVMSTEEQEAIINTLLNNEQDKNTIREALKEAEVAIKGLHNEKKFSRRYPSEESLKQTIKLMQFLNESKNICLDPNREKKIEKQHFLARCLQDGTAGYGLTAFQEFFGDASPSSTYMIIDKDNKHNLLKRMPTDETIGNKYYLTIPLGLINTSGENDVIAPATVIPISETTLVNRLTTKEFLRYKVVINRKTREPITKYQELISPES